MDLEALKPGEPDPNTPAEVVLPEENDEPDVFDEEAGVDDEVEELADFDAEEQNAKEVS